MATTTKNNATKANVENNEAKVVRKPNGAKVKAPVEKKQPAPKPAEVKPVETKAVEQPAEKPVKAPKEKAVKEPKAPKVDRRALVSAAIHLVGDVQFETTETAKKGENSAMVINDGALMLTQVKGEKARRILEIYLHARDPKAILLITKSVYTDIQTVDENTPAEKKSLREAFLKKYSKDVQPPKKGSKLILNLEGDQAVADFANALMLAM